jgi:hypothetical protein
MPRAREQERDLGLALVMTTFAVVGIAQEGTTEVRAVVKRAGMPAQNTWLRASTIHTVDADPI